MRPPPPLEHKKRGASQEAPRRGGRVSLSVLETQLQAELQSPHLRAGSEEQVERVVWKASSNASTQQREAEKGAVR